MLWEAAPVQDKWLAFHIKENEQEKQRWVDDDFQISFDKVTEGFAAEDSGNDCCPITRVYGKNPLEVVIDEDMISFIHFYYVFVCDYFSLWCCFF